jgi:hypothetical protein
MGQFSASNFTALVNAEFKNTRYMDVSLTNSFDGVDSGTVTANLKALTALPTGDNVIHIIISENDISYVTAPNGVTHPDDVMRNMVTGSDGESVSLTPNQTLVFSKNYRLLPKWKMEDCYITVFVQSISTKQIYGVERIKISN